jgi:hypothetical protein
LVAEVVNGVAVVVGKTAMFRHGSRGTSGSGLWILNSCRAAPEVEPDVLLVPMLAFDRKGTGWAMVVGLRPHSGKLRAQEVTAIGVAYAGQVEAVPHDDDQPWIGLLRNERLSNAVDFLGDVVGKTGRDAITRGCRDA